MALSQGGMLCYHLLDHAGKLPDAGEIAPMFGHFLCLDQFL